MAKDDSKPQENLDQLNEQVQEHLNSADEIKTKAQNVIANSKQGERIFIFDRN
jgi:hypothetical protein